MAEHDLDALVFPFDIADYLVAATLQREIAFDLENQGITGKSLKTEVDDIIATGPFSEHTHQLPETLSGGEKQLLAIFAALQQPFNLFIGQHCFDFVSEQNQALIQEHLIGREKCILDITYHAGVSSQYCWIPEDDRLVLREPDQMQTMSPEWLSSMKPWSLTAQDVYKGFESSGFSLQVQNLVLDQVHCLGIFGENGSGKTTFADCLTGITTYDGKLSIHIPDIDTPRFGYLIQHTLTQTHGLSPEDIIHRFVSQSKLNESRAEDLQSLLQRSNYYSSLAEMDAQLGYRMIIMAALLAGQYDLVVLDEPTYGLPSVVVAEFLTTLVDELGAKPLAFISHDRNFTSLFCNRAIQMKNGSAYEASLR
ncbi:ATP-binding cassette domain-containing protein [Candidatus Neomarinimicrobiota bacterium]